MFEKTIYTRIYLYLVKKNLIFDKQFGFHSNYSTNHKKCIDKYLRESKILLIQVNMYALFLLTMKKLNTID